MGRRSSPSHSTLWRKASLTLTSTWIPRTFAGGNKSAHLDGGRTSWNPRWRKGHRSRRKLEEVRTLLKEERQTFKEKLKTEIKSLCTSMTQTLERFQGELGAVTIKVEGLQIAMDANRAQDIARMGELEKRMGAVESRSTTFGSERIRWR